MNEKYRIYTRIFEKLFDLSSDDLFFKRKKKLIDGRKIKRCYEVYHPNGGKIGLLVPFSKKSDQYILKICTPKLGVKVREAKSLFAFPLRDANNKPCACTLIHHFIKTYFYRNFDVKVLDVTIINNIRTLDIRIFR